MVNDLTCSKHTCNAPSKAKAITYIVVSTLIIVRSVLATAEPVADESLVVRHYQAQERYTFGAKLLALALSKSGRVYNLQAPKTQLVNERRGESMVINGSLDVQWHSTSKERESRMIPIYTPIYRGILGLRLILSRKDQAHALSEIRTKKELSHYMGAHGAHWGDLPVYKANNLPVRSHVDYKLLFKWLISGRVDYFHRGINEIWPEQERYAQDITVVSNVMLFYHLPVYFFVSKQRPQLAEHIHAGLLEAIKDGSYKKIFIAEYQSILDKSNLIDRHLILLNNPSVPKIKDEDMKWWLPASKLNRSLSN